MKPLGVGILGTGAIVRRAHLPALAVNPRASVVAIGNHRASSIEPLAREFGIAATYIDFNRMARDAKIEIVVNALPNYLHAPVTIAMLKAGKHVLCEKPMAITLGEAQAMVDAAEAAGRKLMIAHVWRASREVQWLREVIRGGRLGTIRNVVGHAVVAGAGPKPGSWFVRRQFAGGGALADVGIHAIDTISFLFDDARHPLNVSARTERHDQRFDVEDTAEVSIEYDSGMIAQITAGWHGQGVANRHGAIEVFGTNGYARTLPAGLRLNDSAGVTREQLPASVHPDDDPSIYAAQIDHVLDCILHDRSPTCDARQGLRTMAILEAAYESARIESAVSPEFSTESRVRPTAARQES